MKMDEETFAEYAKKLEFEDFEDEVKICFNLSLTKVSIGNFTKEIRKTIRIFGSGALPGLMLDLGLLKISLEGVFSYFYLLRGALTMLGTILIFFQSLINLT